MYKRKIEEYLKKWKKDDKKECLLVRGARQIGKTTSIREFGKNYESFIEVNFLKTGSAKKIFSGDLDTESLILNFSLYMPEARFIPGKTLVFLDEIQECPEAMTSLKFWREDHRFDVIASGSMLGIDLHRPKSYPVGSVTYYDMQSMCFEEFLRAYGLSEELSETLRSCFNERKKVPDAVNDKMMELLRTYMVVGGMPEAVKTYLDKHSLSSCYEKQQSILRDYRYDIAHYASADVKLKAEKCYFSLPEQLSGENRKFQYSVVEKGGNARKYQTSLDWLLGAYLVICSDNVSRMTSPLKNYKEHGQFRLYASDIGLLTAMYDYDINVKILEDSFDKAAGYVRGGLYEALIAEMLWKSGHHDLYFRKDSKGTFELEFLIEENGDVIPVEVKAKNSRSKSLDHALEREEIPYGYKLISGNEGVSGKKITLPLYMAMYL